MAIKPNGRNALRILLDERAIVLVDLETGSGQGISSRPSSDAPTHLVLYQCFAGVGGIVHYALPAAGPPGRRPVVRFPASDHDCTPITSAVPFPSPVRSTRTRLTSTLRGANRGNVIVEAVSWTRRTCRGAPGPRPRAVRGGSRIRSAQWRNAIALEAVAALAFRTQAIQPDPEELDERLRDRHFARKHGESRLPYPRPAVKALSPYSAARASARGP